MASGALCLDRVRIRESCILVLSFALVLSAFRAQAQDPRASSQAPPAQNAPVQVPEGASPTPPIETTATQPQRVVLPDATPVKLRLLHALNSKTVVEDDPLNFAVAEDVLVNGKVLVRAGSVAIGRVRHAKAARMMGRGAELEMEMQYLKVGRMRVPLRGSQARSGENKAGETVALTVLFGLSGLVKHGSEIQVKEGSIFTAYVDRDTELPPPADAVTPVQ